MLQEEIDCLVQQAAGDSEIRPIVADALEEASRYAEAALLRSEFDVDELDGRIVLGRRHLVRVSDVVATNRSNYERRETVVTRAEDYDFSHSEIFTMPAGEAVEHVRCWMAWLDRMHAASRRVAEFRITHGGRAVDSMLQGVGVQYADWENLPDVMDLACEELALTDPVADEW